ncbi:unnamed protein product [Rotaria socialis]|uniref:Phosphodiesterase n=1 Tax=Rotaria socialis TaxID=392032 RepID=A0A818QAV5_9BILA|nr:unnamed protein product [Rotaria socialis]CAF3424336.1 unnamed protein product [Rotaria socialis]CAF3604683.1 unnamed protein product [Rotaria socialis]CAF3635441.1 unnamed protein product [Rotaria socialis]
MADRDDYDDDDYHDHSSYKNEQDDDHHDSSPPFKRFKFANSESSPSSLTASSVGAYLGEHPEFLDSYVQQNVHTNTIEQWLSKRPEKKSSISSSTSTSTPIDSSNKNNTSTSIIKTDDVKRKKSSQTIKQLSSTTVKSMNTLVELNDKRRLLHELTDEVNQNVSKAQILYELSKSISSTVSADGFNLYLVDETGTSIRLFTADNDDEQAACFIPINIGPGHCLAGYVAWSKETVRISDTTLFDITKYPDGLYVKDDKVTAVMAHPIINTSGTLLGAVEFFRIGSTLPFTVEDEEETLKCVNELFTQTYYELYHSMTRERRLNDFLLAVTKSIFQELVSMEAVMLKIMSYAKKLVNADRASLFIVDSRTKELYARIFDIGREEHDILDSSLVNDKNELTKKQSSSDEHACIRFPMDKGIAGYVATTGKTLNIVDAYSDERFNRDIDQKTGYKTKTLLCMPIMIQGHVIGVVQMVNKRNGHFTKSDEESFETFAVYCGLALHHASLYDRIRRSEQKCKVALEVLSYHASCTDEEYERYKISTLPSYIPNLKQFEFSPWSVANDMKPIYVLYMFRDLTASDSSNLNKFDMECLIRFTLTVRKNYRNVPYHNWSHAFSVAHAIYTVIKETKHNFTANQCIALFVACLCHDLDHRGKTNDYMVKSSSTLASIYSTSTMERHHFNQTVTILQTESLNIFKHFSPKEYRQMLDEIRHCILATDLVLFFENRPKLERIVESCQFDWNNKDHMQLMMGLSMTAADLCSSFKQWEVQRSNVSIIMEEFFQQGDDEKRRGIHPQSLMDRSLAHELPKNQVNFISCICLPCYSLIVRVLPETMPMLTGARSNLQRWQELADEHQSSETSTNISTSKEIITPTNIHQPASS